MSMKRLRTWLAVLFAVPISIFAVRAIALTLGELVDPCLIWSAPTSGHFYRRAHTSSTAGPCAQYIQRSDTKTHAILLMLAVPGVILLAAVLGIMGMARSRQWMVVLAGLLMVFEAAPTIFSIGVLALLAGVGLLILAFRLEP